MRAIGDRVPVAAIAVAASALWAVEQLLATGPSSAEVLSAAPLTLVGGGASVMLAPTRPLVGLAVFVASYAGQVAVTGWVDSVVALLLWCGLLGLAARRTQLPAACVAAAVGAVPLLVFVLGRDDRDAGDIGPSTLALWLLPWITGRVLRARHLRHDQELALVRSESERRAAEERVAAADRRAALARDVHDLLGHTLTSLVVQARSARASVRTDPERATRALDAVEDAGQAAVAELRSLVAGFASSTREKQVEPTLQDLPGLVDRLPVQVRTDLDPDSLTLPLPLQAATYRIVQEALTNTVRHSRADSADVVVRLDHEEAVLHLEVSDPGPPARAPLAGAGTGLAGMRSRAEDLGGQCAAGRDGAGFVVRARIPLGRTR